MFEKRAMEEGVVLMDWKKPPKKRGTKNCLGFFIRETKTLNIFFCAFLLCDS